MPANYVALLGQQKKVLAGYSQSSTLPHTGFIYYSDLVQKLPPVSVDIYKLQILFISSFPRCNNYYYNHSDDNDDKPTVAKTGTPRIEWNQDNRFGSLNAPRYIFAICN